MTETDYTQGEGVSAFSPVTPFFNKASLLPESFKWDHPFSLLSNTSLVLAS
jgi:hypothetical protein